MATIYILISNKPENTVRVTYCKDNNSDPCAVTKNIDILTFWCMFYILTKNEIGLSNLDFSVPSFSYCY